MVSVEPNSPAQTSIHGAKGWLGDQASASCGLEWPPGSVGLAGGLRGHGVVMMASLGEKSTCDAAWDISVQSLAFLQLLLRTCYAEFFCFCFLHILVEIFFSSLKGGMFHSLRSCGTVCVNICSLVSSSLEELKRSQLNIF